MSKRRLVITAVLAGESQSEVSRRYGVSQPWVSRLMADYRLRGEAAFEPHSRRPHTYPTAIPDQTVALILRLRKELSEQGLDAGPRTIWWHLSTEHDVAVSRATVSRVLTRHGLVVPDPSKRPRSSFLRFAAEQPNETWQSDFTHYRLTRPDGTPGADVEILSWLDDHARYALSVTAHHRVTGPIVLAAFRDCVALHGIPASTLTDNGMVFTTRLSGGKRGKGTRNGFEHELRRLGIVQKNSRPNHPTTCGKVERFQQTLKKWLRAQPVQPTTLAELQALIDTFVQTYNHRRPHKRPAPPGDPRHPYAARPKASPGRPQRRLPRPRPQRPDRHRRQSHPAPRRPALLHRRRTNPRPNPRPAAGRGPRHPHHRRRHRRTPTRAHPRHHQALPGHRPTTRPTTEKAMSPNPHPWVRAMPMS